MNFLSLLRNLGFFCKKERKGLSEDQLRRRLRTIESDQALFRKAIAEARRTKKRRTHFYAEMEALTTERLQIEGQLASMGPNSVYMQGS